MPAQNIFNSNSCGNEYNTESLQGCTNSCDNSSTSIISNPYHLPNNNTASKTVSVNFILLRDDNGQKGFDKTNAEHVKYFQDVVSLLNNRYSDLQPSTQSSPSTCEDGYLSDTKIRFSVEIVNWDESNYWDNQNSNL